MRVTGADPERMKLLLREGITLADFAKPEARIRHRVAMELLRRSVEGAGGPELGLRAADHVEAGAFDPLDAAAPSCANLREAILCIIRFLPLLHDAQESLLVEDGEHALWTLRTTDDVPQVPAANEFTLACACAFVRRSTDAELLPAEVHFRHATDRNLTAYRRIFGEASFRLGMPHNALVFPRACLDAPMRHAHAGLKRAFESHADALLQRLQQRAGMRGRVRQLLLSTAHAPDVCMANTARKLGVSVQTMRRRLADEGTSYGELLMSARFELAQRYLADPALTIGEVAEKLGFSHVTAFYKAFRRWSEGETPAEVRARSLRV